MDALIFNKLEAIASEEDEARKDDLRRESAAELGEHFARHSTDLEELAFDLLNGAWADSLADNPINQLIEVNTVGLGEEDYVEGDLRGMRAYWQGKGGQIRSDILRYERERMPREEIVTAIDMHVDEMRLNFWGSFDKLSAHAMEKMRILPLERLIELIQAAIGSGDPTYGTFAASTLTDTQVDSVLDVVAAKASGVAIVGTQVAIRKLSNVGLDFGDNIAEEIFRTGLVARYKGYPVVQLENSENFEGDLRFPDDELWIVGRRSGRLTFYGDAAKVQTLQLPSFQRRWESARDAGMLLYGVNRGRLGRIVLT